MLPSELLRIRVRQGKVYPLYAHIDTNDFRLAEQVIETFRQSVGKKKGELREKLKAFERGGFDFRLVRGLSTLLERRCVFGADSPVNPREARMMVFEEASRAKAVSVEQREKVLQDIAVKLNTTPEALERTIYCDVDEELILRDFEPIEADLLIKQYNLSVTQTLLFKSLRMEFTCSGNWQKIFRSIKRLGLMYSIERGDQGNIVSVDGPLSLFKMVDRYGTSVAKLLPQIVASKSWKIRAEVLGRNRDRIYLFELGSDQVKGFMEDVPVEEASKRSYDSSVEEHFARSFMSYDSGWKLEREPEPLVAGNYVLIPDFKFTKANLEVYLEIVGFWTQDYLEKKVSKLKSLTGVDMIVAVNENYAGSKFGKIKAQIIYYRNSVPIKPILDHLRKSEEAIRQSEAKVILPTMIRLEGDIVDIEDIARKHSISVESAKEVLQNLEFEGYRRIGDSYVSISKLEEIGDRLRSTVRLSDALALIGAYGIRNMYQVIEALGYTVEWNGLDLEKSKISKKQS